MRRLLLLTLLLVVAIAGCVSTEQKQSAIAKVNKEFRECYERTIGAEGRRHYSVSRRQAMSAATRALETLGMTVVREDSKQRFVRAQAPAPAPLSDQEWSEAVAKDGPRFREIVAGEVGLVGYFVGFEPEGLDVVITITAVDSGGGCDLSATMRLVERTPPPSGWPRREYPPCEALANGVRKLWRSVDEAL